MQCICCYVQGIPPHLLIHKDYIEIQLASGIIPNAAEITYELNRTAVSPTRPHTPGPSNCPALHMHMDTTRIIDTPEADVPACTTSLIRQLRSQPSHDHTRTPATAYPASGRQPLLLQVHLIACTQLQPQGVPHRLCALPPAASAGVVQAQRER